MNAMHVISRKSWRMPISKCLQLHIIPGSERHLSTGTSDSPLYAIQEATKTLKDFSSRLAELSNLVDKKHVLIDDRGLIIQQDITLPQVVLHSRDADLDQFKKAAPLRNLVMETALATEKELRSLAGLYPTLSKQMANATKICQETPCGGVSWILDLEALQNNPNRKVSEETGNQHVSLDGMESPCGQLHQASLSFLQQTFHSKDQAIMGSRALLILQLAMDLNRPLQYMTKEENQKIRLTFENQVVPTPWIRTDEEYQQLLQLEADLTMKE